MTRYIDMIDQAYCSDIEVAFLVSDNQCTLYTKEVLKNGGWLWSYDHDIKLLFDCKRYPDGLLIYGSFIHDEDDEWFTLLPDAYKKESLLEFHIR